MKQSAELLYERTVARFETGRYREYRIPGIIVTARGTLLCCCEGRMDPDSDWGSIDIVLWRSDDDGAAWDEQVLQLPGEDMLNNPTLIADGERVLLLFHASYARAYCMESLDDGRTWSQPWEITAAYREFSYEWNVCATGPGHGIALKSGRLLAPVWLANGREVKPGEFEHHPSAAGAVYSDDHGRTWHAGALETGMTDANETCIAQLADGRVLFNFRNCEVDYRRRLGISADGGETLQRAWACDELPDPWCFGGMSALEDGAIAFVNCESGAANPEKPRARIRLTAKLSNDGRTWQELTRVDEKGGYADIAVRGGEMYVLYEITDYGRGCISEMKLKKYRINQ